MRLPAHGMTRPLGICQVSSWKVGPPPPDLAGADGTELHICLFINFVDCAGSLLLQGPFSSCRELELPSRCGVWASHCRGFSCCGAQALGHVGISNCSFQALEHRLVSGGART